MCSFLEAEGVERIREAYPEPTYRRLAEIKRHFDPTNLFRLNQNIVGRVGRLISRRFVDAGPPAAGRRR